MFTLRTITLDGLECNQSIGDYYVYVSRERNYEAFSIHFEKYFEMKHVADLDGTSDKYTKETYGFLVYQGGSQTMPLYIGQKSFIMTDDGKTFDNITFR